jgi:uncharacterized membrane protein
VAQIATAWTQPCVAASFRALTIHVSWFASVLENVAVAPGESWNPPPSAFSPVGQTAIAEADLPGSSVKPLLRTTRCPLIPAGPAGPRSPLSPFAPGAPGSPFGPVSPLSPFGPAWNVPGLKSAAVRLPFFTFGPVTAFFFSCAVPTEFFARIRFPAAWPSGVGGLLLTVLGLRAERAQDPNEMATLARQAAFAGEKLFAPAGLIVLAMGIAMMVNTNWGWGKFWIVAGLVGYGLTFVTGVFVLSPLAKKIDALLKQKGPTAPETQAAIQRILLVARFDIAVLLLVVADMVTKPFS